MYSINTSSIKELCHGLAEGPFPTRKNWISNLGSRDDFWTLFDAGRIVRTKLREKLSWMLSPGQSITYDKYSILRLLRQMLMGLTKRNLGMCATWLPLSFLTGWIVRWAKETVIHYFEKNVDHVCRKSFKFSKRGMKRLPRVKTAFARCVYNSHLHPSGCNGVTNAHGPQPTGGLHHTVFQLQ